MRIRESADALVVVIAAAGFSAWSINSVQPPKPLPATAPDGVFSAARAMKHVEAIAQRPHAVGQEGHDAALRYIQSQFADLGLEPQIQATTVTQGSPGGVRITSIQNIAARLTGTGGGPAVLLLTHYDSVPTAPGASDAAHGVAVLLETLRALHAGAPLKRDIIFLITDAEEFGLLGARAFLKEHPWRKDFDLVINFEARGTGGPSIMFETSSGNGRLIEEFARAAPHPVANSLSYEAYRRLPNDTDLTVFKRAGFAGLNFAYIGDSVHYHTSLDNVANLDQGSLQQAGASALALARHFGDLDRAIERVPDETYFTLPLLGVVHYPAAMALPLAIGGLVLCAAAFVVALFRHRATWRGLLAGFATLPVTAAAAALAVWAIWKAEAAIQTVYRAGLYDIYGSRWYHAAFAALALFLASCVYAWLSRRTAPVNLLHGGLLWWFGLAIATAVVMPGASYLFFWPALVCLAATVLLRDDGRPAILPAILAALSVFFMAPTIDLLFTAFPVAQSMAAAALAALSWFLLLPVQEAASRPWRGQLPAVFFLAFTVCLAFGNASAKFDKSQPQPDSLMLAHDADTSRSYWLSADNSPDGYTRNFLGAKPASRVHQEFFPLRTAPLLSAPAIVPPLEPPVVKDAAVRPGEGKTTISFRLRSARRAPMLSVWLEPGIEVLSTRVNGEPVEVKPGRWSFTSIAFDEGVPVEIDLRPFSGPLRLLTIDRGYTSPAPPRPPGFMPRLGWPDSTTVSKAYELK